MPATMHAKRNRSPGTYPLKSAFDREPMNSMWSAEMNPAPNSMTGSKPRTKSFWQEISKET